MDSRPGHRVVSSLPSPLPLRAHILLCLQGFRGEGYDPAFVENLSRIHGYLASRGETAVRVVDHPDVVCQACPHLGPQGCALHHPGSEQRIQTQDRTVMARLGIRAGQVLPWREILARIGRRIASREIPALCGGCRWASSGTCRAGVARLANRTKTIGKPSRERKEVP